jgi:hypothetical protein
MRQDSGSVFSLAFVDVLANSFASLLVLFFIMVALRGALGWSEGGPSEGSTLSGSAEPQSPFLVLVKAPPGPLQAFPGEDLWIPTGEGRDGFDYRTTSGDAYAVLYADRPPPAGVVLRLHLVRPHPDGTIQVYQGGRILPPQKFAAQDEWVTILTGE